MVKGEMRGGLIASSFESWVIMGLSLASNLHFLRVFQGFVPVRFPSPAFLCRILIKKIPWCRPVFGRHFLFSIRQPLFRPSG